MTLTKIELVQLLIEKHAFSRRQATLFVSQFFELMVQSLEKGEEVKLSGFGNFITRDKVARPGRNPKTRENIPVSARRVVIFHAGKTLKKLVKRE
ncbi:MAG: integration host factor subunit alpha [Gammaproteobacteria bacterium]|nr:integration host factor subunit alpha [Gammaproteobacteria bacterium]